MKSSGFSIIKWQSNGTSGTALRREATTGGPMVMLGTKWPSMMSTCRTVPPPSMADWACWPRREKSAERIDGASSMGPALLGWGDYTRMGVYYRLKEDGKRWGLLRRGGTVRLGRWVGAV